MEKIENLNDEVNNFLLKKAEVWKGYYIKREQRDEIEKSIGIYEKTPTYFFIDDVIIHSDGIHKYCAVILILLDEKGKKKDRFDVSFSNIFDFEFYNYYILNKEEFKNELILNNL